MPSRSRQFRIDDIIEAINKIWVLYIWANFKTSPFVRYLRQAQILILEILLVFLWLKFSPSLISNKIEHFETASYGIDFASWQNDEKTVDAVIRNLEVIGEASSHLPIEIQEQYEYVPWGMMKGFVMF